ncbi:MAG: tol-pal system protein YbgF [Deltaproteobacteria bacterium]|nr:tol-pal system protein YbgF [Deltaproteobacteria bacterium]
MSAKRNRLWLGSLGLAIAGAFGCAGSELRSKVAALERTIDTLQRDLALARTRLDDMANQVALLTVNQLPRAEAATKDRSEARAVAPAIPGEDAGRSRAIAAGGEDERIRSLAIEKVRRRARVSLGPEPGEKPIAVDDPGGARGAAGEAVASADVPGVATRERDSKPRGHGSANPGHRGGASVGASRERAGDAAVQKSYLAARRLFETKRYLDAISAFTDIAKRHADHSLAENATFWIGAAYFERREYALALREFQRVVSDFAKGRKRADAIYRAGLCHLKLGAVAEARERFLAVVDRFPASDAARSARQALADFVKE